MIYLPNLPSTLLVLTLMTILTSKMKLGRLMYYLSSEICLTRNYILDAFWGDIDFNLFISSRKGSISLTNLWTVYSVKQWGSSNNFLRSMRYSCRNYILEACWGCLAFNLISYSINADISGSRRTTSYLYLLHSTPTPKPTRPSRLSYSASSCTCLSTSTIWGIMVIFSTIF